MFGVDIASGRIDDLDKGCILYALSVTEGNKQVLDIGSGRSRLSAVLVLLNFKVLAVDIENRIDYFAKINTLVGSERASFLQKDIREIGHKDVPKKVSIIILQRILHHIPFGDTQRVLGFLISKLEIEGKMFISFSGLDSELGNGYDGAGVEIENRFGELSEENKKKFFINSDICLYTEDDVKKILEPFSLCVEKIWQSKFGNIKVIARKV